MDIESIIKDWKLYIIIGEAAIIVVILLWHFLFSDNGSEGIESLRRDKHDLKRIIKSKDESLTQYKNALIQAQYKLKQWDAWYEQNKHVLVRDEPKSPVIEFELSDNKTSKAAEGYHSYQYLQEANNGKFMKLLGTTDKCYFRTWEEGGVRKYEFYGNVDKALANINAIFDDVCDIEGKRSGASDIENVCPGTLDSELRIINKAKIKLK